MPITIAETYKIRDREGNYIDIKVSADDYKEASKRGISLSAWLHIEHGAKTDSLKYGPVISQMMANSGLLMSSNLRRGIKSPSIEEVFSSNIRMGALTSPDGTDRTPAGRLLYPEIIARVMEEELRESNDDFFRMYERMFSTTQVIDGARVDIPLINAKYAEDPAAERISELAEPVNMVTITTGNKSKRVATKSIGLKISDEAQANTTLELVAIVLRAQARGERMRMAEETMSMLFNGDPDVDEDPISTIKAVTLDPAITQPGVVTQKALIKFLRRQYKKRTLNYAVGDLDVGLAMEERAGKPTKNTAQDKESDFAVQMTVDNLQVPPIPFFMTETWVAGANAMVALDTSMGAVRLVNVRANYSAVEQFLMNRSTGYRFDYAETAYKLYNEAFERLSLTL